MKKRFLLNNEQGAAAVEFALLLPLLTLIILGIVMFGMIFNAYLEITHAAREGVRWAALQEPESIIKSAARGAAAGLDLADDDIAVTIGPAPGGPLPGGWADSADYQGESVHVTVTFDLAGIRSAFGSVGALMPNDIRSTATQRVE